MAMDNGTIRVKNIKQQTKKVQETKNELEKQAQNLNNQSHLLNSKEIKPKKSDSNQGAALTIAKVQQKTEQKPKKLAIKNVMQKNALQKTQNDPLEQSPEPYNNTNLNAAPENDAILLNAEIVPNNKNKGKAREHVKCTVVTSVEMLTPAKTIFNNFSDKKANHSNLFFCFQDVQLHEEYETLMGQLENQSEILNLKTLLLKNKEKLQQLQKDGAGDGPVMEVQRSIKHIIKRLGELEVQIPEKDEDLKKDIEESKKEVAKISLDAEQMNEQIKKAYENPQQASSFNGYKIERRDWLGRLTNLSNAAKNISITTMGLNENNAIRLRMASGEYLELHLDSLGNFKSKDENGQDLSPELLANSVIPLTIEGADQTRLFDSEDTDSSLVYNNYAKVIDDLKSLKTLKVNGVDFRDKIISAMEYKLQQHNNKTNSNSEHDIVKKILNNGTTSKSENNYTISGSNSINMLS